LFGKIIGTPQGPDLQEAGELVSVVLSMTGFISPDELRNVFQEWDNGLKRCVSLNGDNID
jgi:hypothetical protein